MRARWLPEGIKDRIKGRSPSQDLPSPRPGPPRSPSVWDARVPAVLIPLCALALYIPCLTYGFVGWDDTRYVTESPLVSAGADGLERIWFSHEPDQYYPLTFTTFWVEHHLWGDRPLGYHATNAALHALTALVLLLVLRGIGLSRWTSCAASLLFGVHPVQVMSVAWVAERKNLLSALFCILAYAAWVRFRRSEEDPIVAVAAGHRETSNPSRGNRHRRGQRRRFTLSGRPRLSREIWYAAALAAFVLALLGKTAVAPLPIALAALDRFVLGIPWRRSLPRVLPFLIPVAVFAIVTVRFEQPFIEGMPARGARPLIAAESLLFYVRQLLAPIDLAPFYPKTAVAMNSLRSWLPVAVLASIAAALWRLRRRLDGILIFGLVHFTAFLLPVLGFADYGNLALSYAGDQYLYLASIGLLLPLARFVDGLEVRDPAAAVPGSRGTGAMRVRWTTYGAAVVLLLLGCGTLTHMPTLRDGEAFWNRTLERYPDCVAAHSGLGRVYESRGQWDRALSHYRRAAELLPGSAQAQVDLARALGHAGRHAEAERLLIETAQRTGSSVVSPSSAGAGMDHGVMPAERESMPAERVAMPWELEMIAAAMIELARTAREERRIEESVRLYEEGLSLAPENTQAHIELGAVRLGLLQRDLAASQFLAALALQPANAQARLGLATSQRGRRLYAEAVATLQEGLRASPESVPLLNLLARILATCPEGGVRDGAAAVRAAERARELANKRGEAPGWADRSAAGPPDGPGPGKAGMTAATAATRESRELLDTLAAAYAEAGRWPEAIATAQAAADAARAQDDEDAAAVFFAHLEQYRRGEPLRETPIAGP